MLEALPRGRPRAPRKQARPEPALARSSLSQQTANDAVHSRKLRGPRRPDNKRRHVAVVELLALLRLGETRLGPVPSGAAVPAKMLCGTDKSAGLQSHEQVSLVGG